MTSSGARRYDAARRSSAITSPQATLRAETVVSIPASPSTWLCWPRTRWPTMYTPNTHDSAAVPRTLAGSAIGVSSERS
jgi:hypothetical protein